ncbi:PREDICTED: voltage-dependent calcium channel subunit alpha-2/delta-1-like [Priapulus caudatus]|uniref:Voltage-dependent calcium channel subunit alpha-2/delta-1-like n=1 Tax=Priapulus caudatus TaxID=37621 RepID=A0ABM1F361_PRICU|nr:PREDICTED: voltage-dependent calcium channel subunit alpha-2/delta-1-like [Priapulus caudatus]
MLDPSLMQQLYRDGVFVREQQYDFQALCKVEEDLTSAGVASAYIPSLSMAASRLQWVAQQAARSYVGLNLYSAATGWLKSARAENLDPESEVTEENCIKMAVQYRYGPNSTAASGTFNCSTDDCPRSYHSGRIVETNLLLVVVEPPPINCTCDVAPISVEPERVPGPNVCEAQPRYRRRPANCYSQSQKEDVSPCAGVALQPPSLLLLLLLLLPLTVCATMGAGSTHDISSH